MTLRPAARTRVRRLAGMSVTYLTVMVAGGSAASEAAARDRDRDGLSDRYELRRSHTDPRPADTDRDALRNRFELRRSRTNPRKADTDRDGLADGYEVRRSRTNPREADTDGDGMSDGYELRFSHTNPLKADVSGSLGSVPPPSGGDVPQTVPPPVPLPDPDLLPDPDPIPDLVPPNTTITSGPSGTVASGSASFAFSSSESGSSFQCRLDGGSWGACSSPKAYSGLAVGSRTFTVRATDAAGNTDASPASRSWTVAAAPPPPGSSCMPDPSGCGFPDLETVGVTPGTALTSVNGVVTLSKPGQVYENKLVTGSIVVTAPNVTIRNVKLVATDDWYGISVKNAGSWDDDAANLLLDRVEIDLQGTTTIKGIAFNGYTARHVLFHNGADCAHFGDNVVIEDSMCVLGPDTDSDGWPDATTFCGGTDHFDGFQSDGGRNITLRHNTIRNPCGQTSAILMSSNTSSIRDATIVDNLMAAAATRSTATPAPTSPTRR